jgi:hypothetical protein
MGNSTENMQRMSGTAVSFSSHILSISQSEMVDPYALISSASAFHRVEEEHCCGAVRSEQSGR